MQPFITQQYATRKYLMLSKRDEIIYINRKKTLSMHAETFLIYSISSVCFFTSRDRRSPNNFKFIPLVIHKLIISSLKISLVKVDVSQCVDQSATHVIKKFKVMLGNFFMDLQMRLLWTRDEREILHKFVAVARTRPKISL